MTARLGQDSSFIGGDGLSRDELAKQIAQARGSSGTSAFSKDGRAAAAIGDVMETFREDLNKLKKKAAGAEDDANENVDGGTPRKDKDKETKDSKSDNITILFALSTIRQSDVPPSACTQCAFTEHKSMQFHGRTRNFRCSWRPVPMLHSHTRTRDGVMQVFRQQASKHYTCLV